MTLRRSNFWVCTGRALASYLSDWTNSNNDAKTLAINARATAIATSSGAKNLANYNFGTNAPVSIGGITGSGTVAGSGQSPFAFAGYGGDEKPPSNGKQPNGVEGTGRPSAPEYSPREVYEKAMRNSQGGEIIRGTRVTANQIEGYGSIRNSARTAKSVDDLVLAGKITGGFSPFSVLIDGTEALEGKDAFTGEDLSNLDRTFAGLGFLGFFLPSFGIEFADEIADGARAAGRSSKAIEKLEGISGDLVAGVVSQLKTMCFARDTLVSTEFGKRPIGEILVGERVESYDFETGTWQLRTVTNRFDSIYEGAIVTLVAGDTRIEATIHHPFWVVAGHELEQRSVPRGFAEDEDANRTLPGRWVNSHELRVGDVVIGLSGEQLRINSIAQRWEESFPVSNLEIGEFHNYAVGLDGVLVHNHTICDRGEALLKQGFDSGEYTVADLRKMVEGFENGDEVLKRIAPNNVMRSPKYGNYVRRVDDYKHALDPDHVKAALREKGGAVTGINPKNGLPWDHLSETRNAMAGAKERLIQLKKYSSDPGLSPQLRAAVESELGELSKMLDNAEKILGELAR